MAKYRLNDNILEIFFSERIEYNSVELYSQILRNIKYTDVKIVLLNFKETKSITLPGALYILSFCNYLQLRNRNIITQIKDLNSSVQKYLMSLKFFSTLATRGNMFLSQNVLIEEDLMDRKKEYSLRSMIFPIYSIAYSPDKSNFESYTRTFVNYFRELFLTITQNPVFNYTNSPDDSQELFEALYENIKNIFDHSESEGFGAVHASTNLKGTTMVFYDLGIGIARSVLQARPEFVTNELEALYWALADGNSRRKIVNRPNNSVQGHNQGHGFTVLQKFTTQKKGILTIRTGNYQLIYRNNNWENKIVNWFPGTQIIIYSPTL